MKTLQDFMFESLINESFKSEALKKYPVTKIAQDRWGSANQLMWSEITDDMLHEVTEEEARKLQRKMKESYYILWVSREGYGEKAKEFVSLVTWGSDVVACAYRRNRGESTKSCIDQLSIVTAYWVENPEDHMRRDIQRQRQSMRDGALFLRDAWSIREENMRRYQEALDKMRTGDAGEVQKICDEAMATYKMVMDKYIDKLHDLLLPNTPSSYALRYEYDKINKIMSKLVENITRFKSFNGDKGATAASIAKDAYDAIKQGAQAIAEIAAKMELNQQ